MALAAYLADAKYSTQMDRFTPDKISNSTKVLPVHYYLEIHCSFSAEDSAIFYSVQSMASGILLVPSHVSALLIPRILTSFSCELRSFT